eukprot:3807498-Amphidinium_carterae.1
MTLMHCSYTLTKQGCLTKYWPWGALVGLSSRHVPDTHKVRPVQGHGDVTSITLNAHISMAIRSPRTKKSSPWTTSHESSTSWTTSAAGPTLYNPCLPIPLVFTRQNGLRLQHLRALR